MQAAGLGNPGMVFGALKDQVRRFEGEGLGPLLAWKEPQGGAIGAPRGSQVLQEAWGKERFAIFLALALFNASTHSVAVDVGDREMDHFTGP